MAGSVMLRSQLVAAVLKQTGAVYGYRQETLLT